jgi:hypothetical protein
MIQYAVYRTITGSRELEDLFLVGSFEAKDPDEAARLAASLLATELDDPGQMPATVFIPIPLSSLNPTRVTPKVAVEYHTERLRFTQGRLANGLESAEGEEAA